METRQSLTLHRSVSGVFIALWLSVCIFSTERIFSQVTTFTYSSSGLSTSACNALYPAVNITGSDANSYLHTSMEWSQPFDGTSIKMRSVKNPPDVMGNAFAISYNFQAGYTYSIGLNLKNTVYSYYFPFGPSNPLSQTYGNYTNIRLGTALSLPYTSTSCGPGTDAPFSAVSSMYVGDDPSNNVNIRSAQFTTPSSSYLMVGAWPSAVPPTTHMICSTYVNSITITAVAPMLPEVTNVCSTETFSISTSLPVTWDVVPSGAVTFSTTTGNTTTITKQVDGPATIRATVTDGTGNPIVIEKAIQLGVPLPVTSLTIDNVDPSSGAVCKYTESMLSANPPIIEVGTTYEWTLPNDWTALQTGTSTATSSDYVLPVYPGSDGYVYVRRQNTCGYSSYYNVQVTFDPWCSSFLVGPNPAKNTVSIDGQKKKKNIREVRIIDKTGQVRKMVKYGSNIQRVNLDISGLAPDIYYLKIFDGKTWSSKSLVVH